MSVVSFAQITVDETLTTQQLVEDILVNSPCAEVSNFIASTGTDFGDVNGIAAFDGNGSSFPFESGIILSSGNVANAPGPNNTLHSDGGFGWPGDTDLEANTTATNTNNASFIQFDFVPFLEEISFNFIMASEEYNQNFECTFSDAFAFILTDNVTGTVQNLAVLPGTNIPIEVTNIRYAVGAQCGAVNEEFFGQYNFQPIANPAAPSIPAANAPIDFNGQTVSLTAMGPVTPGNDYTIKLVVADETDTAYDISVYLEAGSFDLGNINLGDDILVTDPEAQCEGDILTLDTMVDPAEATFVWLMDDIVIPGETGPTLDVSQTGTYKVEVTYNQGSGCVATDEISVAFLAPPNFDLGDDEDSCYVDPITLDAFPVNYPPAALTYQWFLNGNPIPGETNSTYDATGPGFYEAEVTVQNCTERDGITLGILDDIDFDLGPDQDDCFIIPLILDATPANYNVMDATFEWFLNGTLIAGETDPTLATTGPGEYEAIVTVGGCESTDSIILSLTNDIDVDLGPDTDACFIIPVTLDATPTNYNVMDASFEWSLNGTVIPGETNATLDATGPGLYEVTVTVGFCEEVDSITLSNTNDIAIDLGPDQESCFIVPVILDATPSNYDVNDATFIWSLNGTIIPGETQATLAAIEHGLYEVTVTVGTCEATDSVTISPVNFTVNLGEDLETCFEESTSITATISDFNLLDASFQWFLNGEELVGETMDTISVSVEGTYSVVVTVGDCTATDEVEVSLRENITVTIVEGDFKTCPDAINTLTAVTDEENPTYQWFKNGILLSGETNATLEFELAEDENGLQGFSVVINVGDCIAEDNINVQLYDIGNCAISQGISPNGDGFNDILDLEFLSDRSGGISNFQVYNRHGLLVFEQSNYINEWFGQTDEGDELPTGTYYLIINFNTQDAVYGNQYAAWIYINRDAN
ncbi:MAG: hypothetical protein CMC70_07335 [Flavobacteriaceae bacterium]|nr:hypothetical protein [Flavobacteriaceae bacterium]